MYWKDIWDFNDSREYEYKYAGRYGAKGEKRAKRQKATPEQIKKQNQINREKRMRRLIKGNFRRNDLWCTLKYPEGVRKQISEVKRDIDNFRRAVERVYKNRGQPFKWVQRMEIGEQGGIHIHLLVNRLAEGDTDILIQSKWKHGRVNYTNVYEQGGFQALAEYIVKQPNEEEYEQLSIFEEKEKKELLKVSSSRNLKRPEPTRKKVYSHRTVKKLIDNGPEPSPGYYIDPDSILTGVNRYTGLSYYQYIEYRIKTLSEEEERKERSHADRGCLYRDESPGTGKRSRKNHVHNANNPEKRERVRGKTRDSTV